MPLSTRLSAFTWDPPHVISGCVLAFPRRREACVTRILWLSHPQATHCAKGQVKCDQRLEPRLRTFWNDDLLY